MLLQTALKPVEEALRSGFLNLPKQAFPASDMMEAAWSSFPVNCCLVLIFTVWAIMSIRSFIFITPHLVYCLSRWKGNVIIDNSLQLYTVRNKISRLMFLGFILIVARFDLIRPSFLENVHDSWRTLAVMGIITAFVMARRLIYSMLYPYVKKHDIFHSAHTAAFNFIIWATLAFLVAAGVFFAFSTTEEISRRIMNCIFLFFYLLYLVRKAQILRSGYSKFASFLYLCALELLPVAALIALM